MLQHQHLRAKPSLTAPPNVFTKSQRCQNVTLLSLITIITIVNWQRSDNFKDREVRRELFQLTYLEDPDVGEISLSVMVSQEELETLKMFCRGGENCCGKADNRLCGEGEEKL